MSEIAKVTRPLPDYPPVKRDPWRHTLHTRAQAEAGKVLAKAVRIPHLGVVNGTLPDEPA